MPVDEPPSHTKPASPHPLGASSAISLLLGAPFLPGTQLTYREVWDTVDL